jgi:hypothetical protein
VTRLERLALVAYFVLLLVLLATQARLATAAGAVGGAAVGLTVVPRLHRLRGRMEARLGADEAGHGLRPRRLGIRIGIHLAVLAVLLVPTVLIPFVGDELFAAVAAAATGFPLVLTAARLRR